MSPLRGSPLTRQLGPTTTNERRADSDFDSDSDSDSDSDGETETDWENFPKKSKPANGLVKEEIIRCVQYQDKFGAVSAP